MEAAKESKLKKNKKKLLHLIRSAENKWHTLLSLIPHVYMDLHELKHTQHTHAPPQIIHTHANVLWLCPRQEGGRERGRGGSRSRSPLSFSARGSAPRTSGSHHYCNLLLVHSQLYGGLERQTCWETHARKHTRMETCAQCVTVVNSEIKHRLKRD